MTAYSKITDNVRNKLIEALGADVVIHDPETLKEYEGDASDLIAVPELVVIPETTEQASLLLKIANEHRFPVIPRGGGSGLVGGCVPTMGGAVLSLEKFSKIRKIDTSSLIAEVEAGVITERLREEVRKCGLFYPPDPAGLDRSTIGGNAATCAGGPSCVKYGVTRDYILGLEAVLPTGEIINTGVKSRKGVVGYDLTRLLVGSEGTLGVITGLTLKLIPLPPALAGLVAVFPSLTSAMDAVTQILVRGFLPSAVEFMDYKCLGLVGEMLPFEVPGEKASLLILETDGVKERIVEEIRMIADICREMGATDFIEAKNDEERDRMWEVRRQMGERINDHSASRLHEDVAVPIGKISDIVGALPGLEEEYGLDIFAFGHAGDGNVHMTLSSVKEIPMEKMEECVHAMMSLTVEMDGTISGEHGIGHAKRKFMSLELSPVSLEIQKGIKKLFDPNGILNPGKVF